METLKHIGSALRCWKYNVWDHKEFLKDGEWKYYYCSLWCFFTDQHLCRKPSKRDDDRTN